LGRIKTLDLRGRIDRAVLYERYGQPEQALEEYAKIREEWKDAVWVPAKMESIRAAQAAKPHPPDGAPKTYALVIGISSYQRVVPNLNFAHTDAALFAQYLKKARGGALPPENVLLLTNAKATTAAIRYAVATFLKGKAEKNDTVLLFIAAHGMQKTS